MNEKLKLIHDELTSELQATTTTTQLQNLRVKYLGKSGLITAQLRELKDLPVEEKKQAGAMINLLKQSATELIDNAEKIAKAKELEAKLLSEKIDITLNKSYKSRGSLHPLTIDMMRMAEILNGLGYTQIDGPEIEYDKYNFELLNIPKSHPAREMQDTYYISDDILLRTQTSNTQPRAMEFLKPPFKVYSIGRVFRKDELDATHTPAFYQVEGLVIDEKLNMADLKNALSVLVNTFLDGVAEIRFRPSYFPFTEPSVEVDAKCNICNGKGCPSCKNAGWFEILGAGMVHPRVLELNGIDSKKYCGYAFGFGFDRFPKMKYKIPLAKMMFEHDLRILRQFK